MFGWYVIHAKGFCTVGLVAIVSFLPFDGHFGCFCSRCNDDDVLLDGALFRTKCVCVFSLGQLCTFDAVQSILCMFQCDNWLDASECIHVSDGARNTSGEMADVTDEAGGERRYTRTKETNISWRVFKSPLRRHCECDWLISGCHASKALYVLNWIDSVRSLKRLDSIFLSLLYFVLCLDWVCNGFHANRHNSREHFSTTSPIKTIRSLNNGNALTQCTRIEHLEMKQITTMMSGDKYTHPKARAFNEYFCYCLSR